MGDDAMAADFFGKKKATTGRPASHPVFLATGTRRRAGGPRG